jgi:hypothetical protein
LSGDVRENGLEERGAGGRGARIVEHVDVPNAGGEGVDGKTVAIVVRVIIDGQPVMEGCESGVVVVVRVGRDGRGALLGLRGGLFV